MKGKAYEELVGANLRGDRGEFFTPRNVQRMAIRMLDVKPEERFLDPACGTGGFLIIAMNQVTEELRAASGVGPQSSELVRTALNERVQDLAARYFFGIDINPDLVKATKMNMVMNNDGSGNILRQDSLLHPHQWDTEFKAALAKAVGVPPSALRGPQDLALFDVVATNPPFGTKLPIRDTETLSQYDLGHVWEKRDATFVRTDQIQSSVPPEILFIERCWQFLKPGGRMAIVLPDAILGAPGLVYVRQWIIEHCRIVASVDMHPDTFQPRNGTQTSILLLQRKSERELMIERTRGSPFDYQIFMAQVMAIGHDKRGNTIFKRNRDGEELLETISVTQLDTSASRDATTSALPRRKIVDDDTPVVASQFLDWKQEAMLGW